LVIAVLSTGCVGPTVRSMREATTASPSAIETDIVTIENGGISPSIIQTTAGTQIRFRNMDNTTHQIASDPHPTHSDLPDLFSPILYSGETYTYKFDKVGQWKYHLEDSPSVWGEIIVK